MKVTNSTHEDMSYRVLVSVPPKPFDPDSIQLAKSAESLVNTIQAECPTGSLIPAAAESFVQSLLVVLDKIATGQLEGTNSNETTSKINSSSPES